MDKRSETWDKLAQSIADGEAVLVLGPEAIPFYSTDGTKQEKTFNELIEERIFNQIGNDVNFYYRKDNLFQFRNAAAKQQAMKEIRTTARDENWIPDAELLRQIVAIPFPLVLNFNPDKHIFNAFCNYFREPQFDFYTTKGKLAQANLVYPDGYNNPLIFNICGSTLDKYDSVILDYYDLFELLKNLLIDHGVSEHITRKLQESDRFILLGFDLEKWYYQLLLHYLNKLDTDPFSNHTQNFPFLSTVSGDTKEFVMQQFNIQHIAPTRQEFELLFKACESKGILRKIQNHSDTLEDQIRVLITSGKFEESMDMIEKNFENTEEKIDLIQIRSRYVTWLNNKQLGLADTRDLDIEINKIRYALLTFAHQLKRS
ncbi:MAG: hypothetical protein JNN28_04380 [Saprospiraceae bacterium]|nr:hypothetical protein [Saprospiraceae bacterium]